MKMCPYFAEEIQDAAIECRHCGENIETLPAEQSLAPVEEPAASNTGQVRAQLPKGKGRAKFLALGCPLGCLGVVGFLFVLGLVGSVLEDTQGGAREGVVVQQHPRFDDRRSKEEASPKSGKKRREAESPKHSEAEAWVFCEVAVESRLKAPRTAKYKFSGVARDVVHLGNGRYVVKSWVESQNSFGAPIRSGFKCIVDVPKKKLEKLEIS